MTSELGHGRFRLGPVEQVPLAGLRPATVNDRLYKPVRLDDPEIAALSASIARDAVLDPFVYTADGVIASGQPGRRAGVRV